MDDAAPTWKADDFHLGARVMSSDGKEVGELVHVIVDAVYKLRSLVVRESRGFSGLALSPGSMLMSDEFVVPREAVTAVSHERVELNLGAADARRLPPYLSYREKAESVGEEAEDAAGVLGSAPQIPNWLEQVANKSATDLEIDGGENVMLGSTGKKLGTVKDILFDGDDLVGVVLLPDGLLKKEVILPRRFLSRGDDLALFAELDDSDIEHLAPFKAED